MRPAGAFRRAEPVVVVRRANPRVPARPRLDQVAVRRAAALYLLGREAMARDVAFLLLPMADEAPPPALGEARRRAAPSAAVRAGAADLVLWTKAGTLLVGFAPAKSRPRPTQQGLAAALRDLGQTYRTIHAETPADAVEQLARLIEGGGR